jgi:hypothetical protein
MAPAQVPGRERHTAKTYHGVFRLSRKNPCAAAELKPPAEPDGRIARKEKQEPLAVTRTP